MVGTGVAASGTLLLMAVAPNYAALAAVSLLLGFASCLPQLTVPFAVGVVPVHERGRAIGVVMGGLLAGILLSRTASGTLASAVGWRATFGAASVVMAGTALLMRVLLPTQTPAEPLPYRTIMSSLFGVVKSEPVLRRHSAVGAFGFASFSVFWSTLSFHLATLGYDSKTAGLFGAIGVVGVIVAPIVGRLAGTVPPLAINACGLIAAAGGFVLFAAGASSLLVLALGVVLLDAGVQASHLANQTVIFGLKPEIRNRLNAVYMVTYFIGGAIGTVSAALTWQHWGWGGVCITGAAFSLLGLLPLVRARASGARAPR